MTTTNDAFLYYNYSGWDKYALAVPNCGGKSHTQNGEILKFVETIGRNLSSVMWHTDSRLRTPPSINTVIRVHKLCIRARALLGTAAVPANVPNLEPAHALPAPEVFRVYPVPYFEVRNSWLKEWAMLTLLALTEAMQHNENARPLEISQNFAGQIGQYIQRVYRKLATELLQVPLDAANDPGFTLTDEQLKSYDPPKWFTATEMIDVTPDLHEWPTENDLEPITSGIPVTMLPVLGRYPTNPTVAGTQVVAGSGSSWVAANNA